jgi:type II secretory pathway component PulC
MSQQLWVVNSSFLIIFLLILGVNQLFEVNLPQLRIKKSMDKQLEKKIATMPVAATWEKIYKNDIFDTFIPVVTKVSKKSLVTPIPEPKAPVVAPPTELPKQEFIDPLKIVVKGIIMSSDEAHNVAMIEDETKSEGLYHLGEKIKDAQIIKIAKNRVVFLRGNGQQELFFLRKDDVKAIVDTSEKWEYAVKIIDEYTYEVDPDGFKENVESLGNFLEQASVVGTVYQRGKPIGIRIGLLEQNNAGVVLGFKKNDIIISVANIPTMTMKDRIKIYDTITLLNVGDTIKVNLNRTGETKELVYKLVKMSKAKQQLFTGEKVEEKKKEELVLSRLQEREKTSREFAKQHPNEKSQQEAIAMIRNRLLENLKARLKHARVR